MKLFGSVAVNGETGVKTPASPCSPATLSWQGPAALAASAGLAMAAAYAAEPSLSAAASLLCGMALVAWQFQRHAGRRRWACLGLSLALWQVGGMGWITSVLNPDLVEWERMAAATLLFALLGALSLGSLLLLAWAARRLLAGSPAPGAAWPLAWWAWVALRDLCWWGGGYGSLSLPLLALPGLATAVPLVGPALFEALLWAALLALTHPTKPASHTSRRIAGAMVLALALAWAPPWRWTAPAGEGLKIVAVDAPASPGNRWTLQARDEALEAIHHTLRRAPNGAVIVTPEVFLPEPPPPTPVGVWVDLLDALDARSQHLLLGTALSHPNAARELMNVALLLTPRDGEVSASVYAKQRLAPVGEQLPWPALFAPLANHWLNSGQRSERRAGPPELAEPLVVAGNAVGVLICHEVAFGDLVAAHAESLIHMASDGWSQDPRAARQALGLARLRAMESGKWLLSLSEGRPALLVAPQGAVRPAAATDVLPAMQGRTPFAQWRGLQPLALALLLAALLLTGMRRRANTSLPSLAGSQS